MRELLEKTLQISKEINEFDPKSALRTALATGAIGGITAGLGLRKGLSQREVEKPVVTTRVERPVETLGVDIDRIAEIESSNNPKAENSKTGARGLCQIMKPTWEECVKLMGEDWSWDEAFDPEKNKAVANFYINTRVPQMLKFYNIPDTVEVRLAIYNWGIGNVKGAFEKHGVDFLLVAPEETKKFIERYKAIEESVDESSIDFPQEDLDNSVWIKKEDGTYTTQLDVKDKIENLIKEYSDRDLASIVDDIHIVGSIATNQYLDDCDIDVHIIPKNTKGWSEEEVEKVTKWFNEHRDEIDGYIETHPVEIYIQVKPSQDLMSDGCYDLLNDEWLVGPRIVPMDYDPYEDFSHVVDDVRDTVEDADILLGELKRDVIDYEVIKAAMERMSGGNKKKLLKKMEDKLGEVEDDIEALYKERGEWVDTRRGASKPATPEQALRDVELAKKWKDINAIFKFVNRYHYLKVIKDLKALLVDDEITPDEVDTIKSIIGVK